MADNEGTIFSGILNFMRGNRTGKDVDSKEIEHDLDYYKCTGL